MYLLLCTCFICFSPIQTKQYNLAGKAENIPAGPFAAFPVLKIVK
jgi:hypothetical protein